MGPRGSIDSHRLFSKILHALETLTGAFFAAVYPKQAHDLDWTPVILTVVFEDSDCRSREPGSQHQGGMVQFITQDQTPLQFTTPALISTNPQIKNKKSGRYSSITYSQKCVQYSIYLLCSESEGYSTLLYSMLKYPPAKQHQQQCDETDRSGPFLLFFFLTLTCSCATIHLYKHEVSSWQNARGWFCEMFCEKVLQSNKNLQSCNI